MPGKRFHAALNDYDFDRGCGGCGCVGLMVVVIFFIITFFLFVATVLLKRTGEQTPDPQPVYVEDLVERGGGGDCVRLSLIVVVVLVVLFSITFFLSAAVFLSTAFFLKKAASKIKGTLERLEEGRTTGYSGCLQFS